MDAYRHHLKSLRGQMNDHEDKLALLSAEHGQTQTQVRHLQRDLESVLDESAREKVDIDRFRKEADEASSLILTSQKKLESLNTDAQIFSKAWELVSEDSRKRSDNFSEMKKYYEKIQADAHSHKDEFEAYYVSHSAREGVFEEIHAKDEGAVNTPTVEAHHRGIAKDSKMDEVCDDQSGSKLHQVERRLSQLKEEVELAEGQVKMVTEEYAQLEAGNRALEEELEALKEDKLAEQEYAQSLYERLGQLRGFSQDVVCSTCRHGYSVQCKDSEALACEASGKK